MLVIDDSLAAGRTIPGTQNHYKFVRRTEDTNMSLVTIFLATEKGILVGAFTYFIF